MTTAPRVLLLCIGGWWSDFRFISCGLLAHFWDPIAVDELIPARFAPCIATALVAAPMATVVKAEETTIIKRDRDRDREVIKEREGGDRTVIKKEEEFVPRPRTYPFNLVCKG